MGLTEPCGKIIMMHLMALKTARKRLEAKPDLHMSRHLKHAAVAEGKATYNDSTD